MRGWPVSAQRSDERSRAPGHRRRPQTRLRRRVAAGHVRARRRSRGHAADLRRRRRRGSAGRALRHGDGDQLGRASARSGRRRRAPGGRDRHTRRKEPAGGARRLRPRLDVRGRCCLAAAPASSGRSGRIMRPSEASAAEAQAEAERIAALPTLRRPAGDPGAGRVARPAVTPRSSPADMLKEVSIFSELDHQLLDEIAETRRGHQRPRRARICSAPATWPTPCTCSCPAVARWSTPTTSTSSRWGAARSGRARADHGRAARASIRARRDSELLKLRHADFERLLRTEPSFAVELTRELGRQLQASRPRTPPAAAATR